MTAENKTEPISDALEKPPLSKQCMELLSMWYDNMVEDEMENKFSRLFVKFFKHASKSREKYGIEKEVNVLAETKANLETLWQKKDNAKSSGREEEEKDYKKEILHKYNDVLISIIEEIKEKSLKVEGQKTDKKYAIWATPFLIQYYNIIAITGSTDSIVPLMESDIITYSNKMNLIRGKMMILKTQLHNMVKEIDKLNTLESPEYIKQSASRLKSDVETLLEKATSRTIDDPLITVNEYKRLDIYGTVKLIYKEVLSHLDG